MFGVIKRDKSPSVSGQASRLASLSVMSNLASSVSPLEECRIKLSNSIMFKVKLHGLTETLIFYSFKAIFSKKQTSKVM